MPDPSADRNRSDDQSGSRPGHGPKETISSLIIAFVFAFVFRGFVVEAFVIPTGSMAPTLLGKHTRYQSPESGYTWTIDTLQAHSDGSLIGVGGSPVTMAATDPMTGAEIGDELPAELGRKKKMLSGDRIFVLKYLYSIYDPSRFDVVVFKYPGRPDSDMLVGQQENYIKHRLGLPGEEIALVDGDVFCRPAAGQPGALAHSDWNAEGWEIARKSERTQRELWQAVYSSEYAPLNPERNLRPWFDNPWRGRTASGADDSAWDTSGRTYTYSGNGPTTLAWDNEARAIDDRYYYNEVVPGAARGPNTLFSVADVRLAMGVEPGQDGLELAAVLEVRRHEFRADIAGDRVTIRMRPLVEGTPGEWRVLAEEPVRGALRAGAVTNVEFWHVDQSVQVWIEGRRVAMGEYDWSPALRIENALDAPADMLLRATASGNPLTDTSLYPQPHVRWELRGSPATLHRVRLDRDLYYRPGVYNAPPRQVHTRQGQPALATHPSQPLLLADDQFFVCGDNSPNSADGRAWDTPDPWVYEKIDPTMGVVPRDLLIGKAFFVYFPSLHKDGRVPVPDVGRMRFIW